jgi:hypothetical protein
MIFTIIIGMLIYLVIFASYLELNPSITNVWYRIEDDGQKHFRLVNLFNFIIQPFYIKELWYPKFWDLNFWVGSFFTIFIIKIII